MAAASTSFPSDIESIHSLNPRAPEAIATAEVTCGGGAVPAVTFEVGVTRIGRRSMDLVAVDGATLDVLSRVRFAWIALETDGLSIRPLVEVVSASSTGASVRYRHLFPKQQAQLDAFDFRL